MKRKFTNKCKHQDSLLLTGGVKIAQELGFLVFDVLKVSPLF